MNLQEIKDYRKILETEYQNKDIELESTTSYIIIGALGFFITINEKFLRLQDAELKGLLAISLVFLLTSFVLLLVRKSRTSFHDLKLMQKLDNMQEDNDKDDQDLLKTWRNCHVELTKIMRCVYILLITGISIQVVFFIFNFLK